MMAGDTTALTEEFRAGQLLQCNALRGRLHGGARSLKVGMRRFGWWIAWLGTCVFEERDDGWVAKFHGPIEGRLFSIAFGVWHGSSLEQEADNVGILMFRTNSEHERSHGTGVAGVDVGFTRAICPCLVLL